MDRRKVLSQMRFRSVFIAFFVQFFMVMPRVESARGLDFALISAKELAAGVSVWAVMDARPVKEWEQGRIPGSISFSWETYTETDAEGVKYRTWPSGRLARALGEMGIRETTPIVIYGDADTSWGGEGWAVWVLAWMGHKGPVRLLDGGIHAWEEGGYPVEAGTVGGRRRQADSYKVSLDPSVAVSADEIEQDPGRYVLVDVRSPMERLVGQLPGAVSIEWERFFEGKDRRPISSNTLEGIFAENRIPTGKIIVFYCTGGIRSGYAWAVSMLSGLEDVKNFEGGTEEWEKRRRPGGVSP